VIFRNAKAYYLFSKQVALAGKKLEIDLDFDGDKQKTFPNLKFQSYKVRTLGLSKSAEKLPTMSLGFAFSFPKVLIGFMARITKGVKEFVPGQLKRQRTIKELGEKEEVDSDYEEKIVIKYKSQSMKNLTSTNKSAGFFKHRDSKK